MPSTGIAVAEADVEMVSLDTHTRAERQRQLIRHAQELHHLNLAAARQGLRERTAQADTSKVRCEIARVEAEAVRLKVELAREALREAKAKADLAELQLDATRRGLLSESPTDMVANHMSSGEAIGNTGPAVGAGEGLIAPFIAESVAA